MSPEELLLMQAEADEAAAIARAELMRARVARGTTAAAPAKRPARPSVKPPAGPVDDVSIARAKRALRSNGIEPIGATDAA